MQNAVKQYLAAFDQSGTSGDANPVDQLVVPDSQAAGEAGSAVFVARTAHRTFVVLRIDYVPDAWHLLITGDTAATAAVSYSVWGHHASFPGLVPQEADQSLPVETDHFILKSTDGKWLIEDSR